MARPDFKTVVGIVSRAKEGETVDMIDMRVGEEDMRVETGLTGKAGAKRADACACVENQTFAAAHHLET